MWLLRRQIRAYGFRREERLIRRLLLAPVGLILAYLLAGTIGGLIRTGAGAGTDAAAEVLLLPGPIHTDLLIPVTPDLRARFAFLADAGLPIMAPGAGWLVVGWGAQDFYTTAGTYADIRPGPVWTAITGDTAVMRVEVAGPLRDEAGLTRVPLTAAQFARLIATVRNSFAAETPLQVPGLSGKDAFYPATGRFDILRTCNVWVGAVLRTSGARVGVWTPFTWSLP